MRVAFERAATDDTRHTGGVDASYLDGRDAVRHSQSGGTNGPHTRAVDSSRRDAIADGGAPAAYKVMRRQRPEGPWSETATAVITEATLVEQPRGAELEYRIIAVNKTGDSEPSNTVMVVL